MKYHKNYVEGLDSATTQEQQAGLYLVSVYSVSVANFNANFLSLHYITLSTSSKGCQAEKSVFHDRALLPCSVKSCSFSHVSSSQMLFHTLLTVVYVTADGKTG